MGLIMHKLYISFKTTSGNIFMRKTITLALKNNLPQQF